MPTCMKNPSAPYGSHRWGTVGSNAVCLDCDILRHTALERQERQCDQAEEYELAMKCLDDLGVPRSVQDGRDKGKVYSLVGRIGCLSKGTD